MENDEDSKEQTVGAGLVKTIRSKFDSLKYIGFTKRFYNPKQARVSKKKDKSGLDAVLTESWKKTAKEFGFLPLTPELTDTNLTCIDLTTKRIYIDRKTTLAAKKNGEPVENTLFGKCMHESGHYVYHPYDLTTILTELDALKFYDNGKIGGPKASIMRLLYDDVVNETAIIINHSGHQLDSLYRGLSPMLDRGVKRNARNDAMSLIRAYYSDLSGLNFGVKKPDLNADLQARLEKLKQIDILNHSNNTSNIRAFARLIWDLPMSASCGGKKLNSFSGQEVQKAMQDMAQRMTPEEYKELRKFMKDVGCAEKLINGDNADLVEYYKGQAAKYPIKILSAPLTAAESDYPSELKEWGVSSPLTRLNPYRSFGKIIPGITKQWKEDHYDTYKTGMSIPNSIIIIDSSGSMENPRNMKSNAVVGAFSAARAYMLKGAKVDVINFSTFADETPFKNELETYRAIISYRGGETSPPSTGLDDLLKQEYKDVTVITDGFAGASSRSVDMFMDKLNRLGTKRRVSFIYIGIEADYRYDSKYHNIKFHYVSSTEDIAKIVLGDLQ